LLDAELVHTSGIPPFESGFRDVSRFKMPASAAFVPARTETMRGFVGLPVNVISETRREQTAPQRHRPRAGVRRSAQVIPLSIG